MQSYLTVPQVCKATNLSRTTVYRRIRDGSIPAVKIGGNVRIPSNDLERTLQERKQPQQGSK